MEVEQILIRPLLTEKTTRLQASSEKQYTFQVNARANKFQIMEAVRSIFKAEPKSCNIVNVHGKKKRNLPVSKQSFVRGHGRTSTWKKAIVVMKPGQTIAELEAINAEEV